MPIILLRVDERLIHGQVVVGWQGRLHADRIVVVDDSLAESPWEQELYCLGVPPEIEASFVGVEEARRALPRWKADSRRAIVLLRDIATARRFAEDQLLRGEELNLGGVHHAPHRTRVLPYLFLSDAERLDLQALSADGVQVSARDLPGSRCVPLKELLRGD